MKKYRLRERAHEELLNDLLQARGIAQSDAEKFLEPDFVRDSHDPYLLPDMKRAVERIVAASKNSEQVAVWSDYDCDGIPGGVMLSEFLRGLGVSVTHYIPHRYAEGYGLNTEGIEELASLGVTLIITIDLGTSEHAGIAYARDKHIDVIVTDHHLVAHDLPPAYAVINPKRVDSKYPFDGLCGAGVAWKLVQAILLTNAFTTPEGQEKWLLDLVGIATLSDMVPLVGENRMLAHFGLTVMRRARRPGLNALLRMLRIEPRALTEDDIGFMISPRINAASRMGSPSTAAHLLAATEREEAERLAQQLQTLNDERKGVVAATVKEANKRLASGSMPSPIIVLGNPNWRPGILGLVASALVETHGKPVFLWGREGGEDIKGSCRSDGILNVVACMQEVSDVFAEFGGHQGAGGFSLTQEKVHELPTRLQSAYEKLSTSASKEMEIVVDRQMQLADVPHAMRDVRKLAPFGIGNEKPLFIFSNVSVGSVRTFGKTNNHLEVSISDASTELGFIDARIKGIAFFSTLDSFQKKIEQGARVDVVGHVELDWRGSPRIRIVDVI